MGMLVPSHINVCLLMFKQLSQPMMRYFISLLSLLYSIISGVIWNINNSNNSGTFISRVTTLEVSKFPAYILHFCDVILGLIRNRCFDLYWKKNKSPSKTESNNTLGNLIVNFWLLHRLFLQPCL